MNTSQIKTFAIQSRNILKQGVLNRILALGFDIDGQLTTSRPVKIQGGTVFMDQLREERFYEAWIALEEKLQKKGIKEVCEEAAYTWFNRLVAIRIMQKNHFIEPVMQYVSEETRIPVIVDQARSGRLSMPLTVSDKSKLDELLRDSTKTNEQFNLLISAFCQSNPVIFNCFGGIEKYVGLLLPDNILAQGGFIDLLNNTPYITDEDYTKSELIGWLYQFYISEKKDEVFDGFKKGKKAEAEDIPAATQIFTPNWIVKYMVENTIGRIYLDNNPYADEIKESLNYLNASSDPTPVDAILKLEEISDYKLIDPACGSGHILIEGFKLFYRLYMYEGYSSRKAIENILQRNIIGLDLDTRAKQLATFALLMTAAQVDKSFLDCKVMPRVLDFPEPFAYSSGSWEDFFSNFYLGCSERVKKETRAAFELLNDADILGSIMKFDISSETRTAMENATAEWEKHDFVPGDIATAIHSTRVILALTDNYTSVCANPPYMGISSMNDKLKAYASKHYPNSKSDLFSIFIENMLNLTRTKGRMGCITMESWMFLASYERLRDYILDNYYISSLSHFGWHIIGIAFGTAMTVFQKAVAGNRKGEYSYLTIQDIDRERNIPFLFPKKDNGRYSIISQKTFKEIPGYIIGYWVGKKLLSLFKLPNIGDNAVAIAGLSSGDNGHYIFSWFEQSSQRILFPEKEIVDKPFKFHNKGGQTRKWYGNQDLVIRYNSESLVDLNNLTGFRNDGHEFFFHESISWAKITPLYNTFRYYPKGFVFDSAGSSIFQKGPLSMTLLAFCNSVVARQLTKLINPTINASPGIIRQLPYPTEDMEIEELARDNVSISRLDWDAFETSWNFRINELVRIYKGENSGEGLFINANRLEDIVALYKEHWTALFNKLHSNEEDLNRRFIEIYDLQDELSPDVPLDEITILQNGEISIEDNQIIWHNDVLIKHLISYAIGCWMGRYRLDREGLYIAHFPKEEEVCTYDYNGYTFEIDDDAIIPLMAKDNPFEDDNALQKTVNFLKYVFGGDSFLTKNLNYIEHCLGKTMEDYLVKDFWKDHKKMYSYRPIYWLFSSKKGAFQVLTYMHRMNPYTVERIRTKYLLPYIEYLKGKIEVDEARGADLSTVERKNLIKMKTALDECNEYHDRLHEVALAAIDFDLDDGVVVNYAKFGDVLAKIK